MARGSLFLLAGEASGDVLGGAVLDALAKNPATAKHACWGVGGSAMRARSFDSRLPFDDFTVIGFGSIPSALRRLDAHADTLIAEIMERKPDAVLTIDNKGFALRFAVRLKKRMARAGWHAPVIHLVAPTVWAWGGWRARSFAKVFDHLLCLFAFEEKYFADNPYGMRVTVVGHPAADIKRPNRMAARKALGVQSQSKSRRSDNKKLLAILPGSRRQEITSLLPDMLTAFDILRGEFPDLTAALPMADNVVGEIRRIVAERNASRESLQLLPQDKLHTVLAAADYGFICSGTATLEAAIAGLPGEVYYRPDMLTRTIGGLIANRDMGVLANAVSGRQIYRFLLNREFNAQSMAGAARVYLGGAKKRAAFMPEGFAPGEFAKSLAVKGGFAEAVAHVIADAIKTATPA